MARGSWAASTDTWATITTGDWSAGASGSGYGSQLYGADDYGTPRSTSTTYTDTITMACTGGFTDSASLRVPESIAAAATLGGAMSAVHALTGVATLSGSYGATDSAIMSLTESPSFTNTLND